jgi:hypothetical protein
VIKELALLNFVVPNMEIGSALFRVCREMKCGPFEQGVMTRCHECGRGFGLIRHRWGFRQFCTKLCLQRYKTRFLQKGRNWWLSFIDPHLNMSPVRIAKRGRDGRVASGHSDRAMELTQ